MSDELKYRKIKAATAIFETGCGNTAIYDPKLPPESCEECLAHYLEVVKGILDGNEDYMPFVL